MGRKSLGLGPENGSTLACLRNRRVLIGSAGVKQGPPHCTVV
jgi:hypothetical protein